MKHWENQQYSFQIIFLVLIIVYQNRRVVSDQKNKKIKVSLKCYVFHKNSNNKLDAKAWWIDNKYDAKNIKVIFQLYIIVANIQFVNDCLQIGVNSPINRIALIQILEVLNGNNNKNLIIFNFCEIITHKIQLQLQDQPEDEKNKINLTIQLNNHNIQLMHFEEQKDTTILLRSREQFFSIFQSLSAKMVLLIKTSQKLKLINKTKTLANTLVRNELKCHNFINYRIAKKNTSQTKIWENCNKIGPGPGTILALHCESLSYADLGIHFSDLLDLINGSLPTSILILKKLIYQNQFIETENRAQNIASQLAQLIINDNLFRDRQINIIVHSLGSVVLRRFIELLDQNMDHSKQFINDILIMGEIEDIDLLAKLRWNQVAGRIFNIYTQTDQELKIFKFIQNKNKVLVDYNLFHLFISKQSIMIQHIQQKIITIIVKIQQQYLDLLVLTMITFPFQRIIE